MADQLAQVGDPGNKQFSSPILKQGLERLNRFQAVFLLDRDQRIINYASRYHVDDASMPRFDLGQDSFLSTAFLTGKYASNPADLISLSPVVLNPYSGQTTILIAQPVSPNAEGQFTQLLVGELKKSVIEKMRASISFGEQGHSAMVDQLVKAGLGLQQNNYEYRLPHPRRFAPREIQQLGRAFNGAVSRLITSRQELDKLNQSLQQKVEEATVELRAANVKLEELATIDHLTKLSNRRHFEDTMTSLASRRQSDSQFVCLLLLDIDQFKAINDEYGHPAGDAVLVQIGQLLQKSLRNTDLAARYAGDEFVVLLRADLETGRLRARQLRESINHHHFTYINKILHATVSIGLVSCEINKECGGIEKVLHRVDEAMYEAKRLGRNRIAEAIVTIVAAH